MPGWTRGHVATHLSRNADALARVISSNLNGSPLPMYDSEEQRDADIESGARRRGLEQQVDLDESAHRLAEAFAALPESRADEEIALRATRIPLGALPLARLAEIVLHHVDLDVGHELEDADPSSVRWLLDYWSFRTQSRDDFPSLRLIAPDARTWTFGPSGADPTVISGEPAALLAWVTGRRDTATLQGADEVDLPPIA